MPKSARAVGGGVHPRPWIRTTSSLFQKLVNCFSVLKSSAPSAHYRQVLGGTGLVLGEPIVPGRLWISLVKLSEFLQAAY